MTQPSCLGSSVGMGHGSTGTNQRPKNSLRSGRVQHPHDRRRRERSEPLPRACSSFVFDIRGVVHRKVVRGGQTVNGKFYYHVLRRLREDIRLKRPELWREGNWILRDDNAPFHRPLVTCESLGYNSMVTGPTRQI